MAVRSFRDRIVKRKAMDLAAEAYRMTEGFPHDKRLALTALLRRSCDSIPSNIAEGYRRENDGDLHHVLAMGVGPLREAETQDRLGSWFGFLIPDQPTAHLDHMDEFGRLPHGLSRSLGRD